MTPDLKLEKELWSKGLLIVVGLDEAGRGPWAGPVTAGAVVVEEETEIIPFVRDSKKMSKKHREAAFEIIKSSSRAWGIGTVDSEGIDNLGIQAAVKAAMNDALRQVERSLGEKANFLIIDGANVLGLPEYRFLKINKGDAMHYSIAAASILAKVHRDNMMEKYSEQYPQYGFESHVGYGTAAHREALLKYGPCEIHRKSYKPVKALL